MPEEVRLGAGAEWPLAGAFQITAEAATALPRQDPFAALVVLVVETAAYDSAAFRPAGSAIRLEPQPAPGGRVRGYFHVDVLRMSRVPPRPGRYFVSAWLGDWRSESIPVVLAGTGDRITIGDR